MVLSLSQQSSFVSTLMFKFSARFSPYQSSRSLQLLAPLLRNKRGCPGYSRWLELNLINIFK